MAGEGGGGGAKPVLSIPIDDTQWKAFLESFAQYQEQLRAQGSAWSSTNSGIKKMSTAFDAAEETFDDLVDKAQSPKLGKSFELIGKTSKETARSWVNISKTIEKSSKDLAGMLRDGGKFSGLMGFLGVGAVGVGAAGLFSAVRGANASLADQNILNRKLGLRPGEEKAFSTVFEKAGGDTALLAKVANAQADQGQWKSLMALGITQDQIAGMDPAHLAAEVLRRGGAQFNARGTGTGLWAGATGVSSLMDVNSMRLAGSYQNQFGEMGKQFEELTPKLAAQQKQLDESTAARQKLEASLAQDALELDKAFIKFNPLVISAADGIAKWVTAFAESGDLEKDIKAVSTAFEEVAGVFEKGADALNHLFGLDDKKGADGTPLYSAPAGSVGANVAQFGENVWNLMHGKPLDSGPSAAIDWRVGGSSTSTPTRDQLLDATRHVESSDGKHLIGPMTKYGWQALGPYQMSPADLKSYGVSNPFDEAAERAGAGRKYDDLARKYPGNLHEQEAAYVWGEGNVDNFLKVHKGVWDEHALPDDVQDYLKKMAAASGQKPFDDPKTIAAEKAVAAKLNGVKSDSTADAITKANASNPDNKAVSDMFDRLTRAAEMLRDVVKDGGGSQFRMPDAPRATGSTAMAPYNINVTVTSPAGSSTVVTSSSLVQ